MVGTGRGAQLGVLIKNGAALEQAGRIDVLAVDKTGTLTTGKPVLMGVSLLNSPEGLDENALLALAASLEARSEHPLALALLAAARERKQEAARQARLGLTDEAPETAPDSERDSEQDSAE